MKITGASASTPKIGIVEQSPAEAGMAPGEAQPLSQASGRGWHRAFLVAVCVLAVVLLSGPVVIQPRLPNDHYVYLASNMVQGRLSVDDLPAQYPDPVVWQGHKYLPLGPLPAVLLIPLLPVLQAGVRLVWVGHLFTLLNLWLFYRALGLAGVGDERRRWALLLFFGGTVYFSMALVGASYFLAHVVTVTFLLLAIVEALGKRRPLLVGLFLGLAGMTRLTALFALPFFVWLLRSSGGQGERSEQAEKLGTNANGWPLSRIAAVFAGLAGPVLLLFAYNYLRFGNPLESGYSMAQLGSKVLIEARSHGLFSVVHIPKNLFMMLLQGPLPWPAEDAPTLTFPYVWPSPWGMGLFFASPALIYAFKASRRSRLVQACWLGVACVMLPIVTYYGVGWIQFGYRYALDFMPFLVLLAALGMSVPVSRAAKALVLVSVAVTIWGSIFLLFWI